MNYSRKGEIKNKEWKFQKKFCAEYVDLTQLKKDD